MDGPAFEPRSGLELRPSLGTLQKHHQALIDAYADAMRRASFLPSIFERGADDDGFIGFKASASGPITRALLARHVKHRLKWMDRVYTRLRQAIPAGQDPAYCEWLDRAIESVRLLSQSMPSAFGGLRFLQLPGLSLLAGFLLERYGFPIVGVVLMAPSAIYLVLVASGRAFRLKREVLLPGATELQRRPAAEQEKAAGFNAYRAEEELARCLSYHKPMELQLDYLGLGSLGLAIALGAGSQISREGFGLPFVAYILLTVSAMFVMAIASVRWQRRRWR